MYDDSAVAGPSSGAIGVGDAAGDGTIVHFKSPYTAWQTQLRLDLGAISYQDLKTRIEVEASRAGDRHEMNFLLFRGRRVADEESWKTAAKDIVSSAGSQTMHVVFSFPQPVAPQPQQPATPAQPTPSPTTAPPPPLILNPSYLAVSEAETFATFIQRQCLSSIIDLDPLEWDQMTPKPRISFEAARDWVLEMLRANEIVLDTDADLATPLEGDRKGKGRADILPSNGQSPEAEKHPLTKRLLDKLSGVTDETQETKIAVTVGGYPHNLVLPSPDSLEMSQIRALLRLLAWQRIGDALGRLRGQTPMYTPGSVTSGSVQANTNGDPPLRTGLTIRIRLTTDLLNVITNCLFAAIKVSIVFWMLTRGLHWKDTESLAIMAVGLCWWIWECGSILARERTRLANQLRQAQNLEWARAERLARENGQVPPPPPPPVNAQVAGANDRNPIARFLGRMQRQPGGVHPARQPLTGPRDVVSFDLAHERRVLRLFYDSGNLPTNLTVDDRHIPDNDRSLPLAPPVPSVFYRYIVLPTSLLLGSAFPILEQRRRAAIRRREEHMRLLVEKLTRDARTQQFMAAQANGENVAADAPQNDFAPLPEHVLPRGLSEIARRYYARVLARGEVIDWEEERAAQQAMGGGRNEQEDEQMGLF